MTVLAFRAPPELPFEAALRREVRSFLADRQFEPRCDSWLSGFDPGFSRALGAAGFIGMTIPAEYCGHGRSALERYVVAEELLAAGAPVGAHWIADRQTAPLLLRYGSEEQRHRYLPGIARGELYVAIGMSEPGSGSDLASITTGGERVTGGYRVSGQKVWTSNAHRSHVMVSLVRTAPADGDRHEGLTQVVIDLDADGVEVRPIRLMTGQEDFTEVFLTDVFVPDANVLGEPGHGWAQVMSELAYERSGPERLLSTFPLLHELVRVLGPAPAPGQAAAVGRSVADLAALRRLSLSVAAALDEGETPNVESALVKDLGTRQEQALVELGRLQVPIAPRLEGGSLLETRLAEAIFAAPGFTLRGGTNEILRGVVARGLGLR